MGRRLGMRWRGGRMAVGTGTWTAALAVPFKMGQRPICAGAFLRRSGAEVRRGVFVPSWMGQPPAHRLIVPFSMGHTMPGAGAELPGAGVVPFVLGQLSRRPGIDLRQPSPVPFFAGQPPRRGFPSFSEPFPPFPRAEASPRLTSGEFPHRLGALRLRLRRARNALIARRDAGQALR